jgi:nucleoside-diphosphate-sugar epimerase
MKVLMIGGTGNISTAIVRRLLDEGCDLTIVGRHMGTPGADFIGVDRTQHAAFEEAVHERGEWDCVVDMIGYTPEDARSALRAFAGRTRQFIFCSTVDVFQKPAPAYPIGDDSPRRAEARFGYAHAKVRMEEILEEAAASGAFALTIMRPAATYNDTSTPIGILNSGLAVMRRIRLGLPIIVMGDGLTLWTSAHRDDVGRAIAAGVGNSATFGKAYTLSGDEALTWTAYYGALAEALRASPIRTVGVPVSLLVSAAPQACEWCDLNFKYCNVFDNSPAKRDLGFRYTINWAEGARRMVAYHEGSRAIDGSADHPAYDEIVRRIETLADGFRTELAPLDTRK